MAHSVNYKLPRARKESNFTVYPFTAEDDRLRLQSDNHCMIVFISGKYKGRSLLSPRFNQYPSFEACWVANGGKAIDTPKEITEQINEIIKTPTGEVVTLVGK